MIKFFRKIRQNLLSQGKVSKYLLYATGEIILVVIGILIALQINNRNEQTKLKKSAEIQLSQLYQYISDDLTLLNALNDNIENSLISCQKLSGQFQQIKPFDSLTTTYILDNLLERNFYSNTSAYDRLNQSGEFSILPRSLQNDIIHYYNLLNRVKEREEISNTFIKKDLEPYYFDEYSIYHRKGSNLHPIFSEYHKYDKRQPVELDVERIKNDNKMSTLIFARYYQIKNQQELYVEAIELAQNIKVLIENQLNLANAND